MLVPEKSNGRNFNRSDSAHLRLFDPENLTPSRSRTNFGKQDPLEEIELLNMVKFLEMVVRREVSLDQ